MLPNIDKQQPLVRIFIALYEADLLMYWTDQERCLPFRPLSLSLPLPNAISLSLCLHACVWVCTWNSIDVFKIDGSGHGNNLKLNGLVSLVSSAHVYVRVILFYSVCCSALLRRALLLGSNWFRARFQGWWYIRSKPNGLCMNRQFVNNKSYKYGDFVG